MRVAFFVMANEATGLGHWYRSMALAEAMLAEGHEVEVWSDRQPPEGMCWHKEFAWPVAAELAGCDWVVIDMPLELNTAGRRQIAKAGAKALVLNGVGHKVGDWADIRIVQGFAPKAKYSGPEFVILRPNVFEAAKVRSPVVDWFVFGGAADGMHLTRLFPNWNRLTYIVDADRWEGTENQDDGFLLAAAGCKQACIAMGMTAWELAAMGVPAYVLSISQGHLKFAMQMHEAGLINAWPQVGLPPLYAFEKWLSKPFEMTGQPPDNQACARIMELMYATR